MPELIPSLGRFNYVSTLIHPSAHRVDRRMKKPASRRLTLAELEPLTGTLLTVLLALLGARVTREQALALEGLAQLGVELKQGAGDAHLDRVCLGADAA